MSDIYDQCVAIDREDRSLHRSDKIIPRAKVGQERDDRHTSISPQGPEDTKSSGGFFFVSSCLCGWGLVLLNLSIAGGANAKLLALVQVNIFAALSQNASGAHARADGRANCRTGATTCDGPDDCADAGGRAHFLTVALSRTPALHPP